MRKVMKEKERDREKGHKKRRGRDGGKRRGISSH